MSKRLVVFLLLCAAVMSGCATTIVRKTVSAPPAPTVTVEYNCKGYPAGAQHDSELRRPAMLALYYSCAGDDVPSTPRLVFREAKNVPVTLEMSLQELLKGPTEDERAKGFVSFFSKETAGLVKSVTVTDSGRAIVNFGDLRPIIPNASSSAGSAQFIRELNYTVFHFSDVKEVQYQINGSCSTFYEWLQTGCQVHTAAEYR